MTASKRRAGKADARRSCQPSTLNRCDQALKVAATVRVPACRPGSVHPPKRADGHPSGAAVAGSLMRSTREHRAGRPQTLAQSPAPRSRGSLLTLLQVGFTKPPQSPAALVVSYTTVSPLPGPGAQPRPGAVCFLWHFPAGHPGSALPTTLPCGARTFLTGAGSPGAAARPARPPCSSA